MYEEKVYHSYYMNTPQMWNWTKTHGGPYYAEVGKNIKIDHLSKENITIKAYNGNDYVNATNNTTDKAAYTTVEQDVTKTWIYYEYEPSNVEYYYYKDCIVRDM